MMSSWSVLGRQAAFVAEPDVPVFPVRLFGAQGFIHLARRSAAGQHQMKRPACRYRVISRGENARNGGILEGMQAVENMPSGLLCCSIRV